MRIFMRILLTLYILCVLFVAGVVLACAWNIIEMTHPMYWVSQLYQNTTVIIVASVVGVLIVLMSLVLMFGRNRRREPKSALIAETGNGGIMITLSAIEEMATRHMLESPSVRSVKVGVGVKESKVDLSAKLAVMEETNIPETLKALQTSLKEHIEVLSGIEVGKITLLVEKTSQVVKARVE